MFTIKEMINFAEDQKAAVSSGMILGIMMVLIFAGYLLPVGLDALAAANITTWSAAQQNLFPLIGLFALIGIIAGLARSAD